MDAVESGSRYWSEEPSTWPSVDKVAVSLTYEQTLIEYDPKVAQSFPMDVKQLLFCAGQGRTLDGGF